MSQGLLVEQRRLVESSLRSERKKEEIDRGRDGKTIIKSGQEWTLPA